MKDACGTCELNAASELKKLGESLGKSDYSIALAGNPNTGKSTVFNALTGLRQHTGNWPGKTVTRAEGSFSYKEKKYRLIDLPGTYSLLSTSEDEEVARDFILFGKPDVTVVVVDAGRLQRNLSLVLQIMQITDKVVVCLNLMDEAKKHGVEIELRTLSKDLGVPVIPTSARSREGLPELLLAIHQVATGALKNHPPKIKGISGETNQYIEKFSEQIRKMAPEIPNISWIAMRLLEDDQDIIRALRNGNLSSKINENNIQELLLLNAEYQQLSGDGFQSDLAHAIYRQSGKIVKDSVYTDGSNRTFRIDRTIDDIVTSRVWGFPIMLLMLGFVLWMTIVGSNYPSQMLSVLLLDTIHPFLQNGAATLNFPAWLNGFLIDGVYLATAWVIAVMLPPMAIFFPLFTLLEDFGYLPRVAFNLDRIFKKTGAHGKQALTMSMGFGCNAAGVVATRIINSPREKLIAIITNNFSLCNGRWPTQILIATIFIGVLVPARMSQPISTLAVVGIVLLGIAFTFFTSWLLSKTMLKGASSFFTLELPPYRAPKILQTLYTSLIDRTLIVLWRAVIFAAPAGAIIWLISNITIGDQSIALRMIDGLNPFGVILGLNGVIILAYIVAIPANEIVIPTILMLTVLTLGSTGLGSGAGVMFEGSEKEIAHILYAGGWTTLTGINLMLFSLLHNPCSTTIYTIYKETGSAKWTTVASLLPVVYGLIVCFTVAAVWNYFV